MADWFESRFKEPVDAGPVDPAFAARVRAMVVEEWQADAGSTPSVRIDPDDHEGDLIMLETEDRPTGDDQAAHHRRSPGRWLLVAAVAAVIAVVGTLIVAGAGDDDHDQVPATTIPPTPPAQDITVMREQVELVPGPYYIDPDGDGTTPLRVTFEVAHEGWMPFVGAYTDRSTGDGHAAVHITTVQNLVADGCVDHAVLDPAVGPTVDDLATAMTELEPFEVTAAPTDVTLFGYSGKHLAWKVPTSLHTDATAERYQTFSDCVAGQLQSWLSPYTAPFYGYEAPGHTEEFWILDVQGTRLVLIKDTSPGMSAQDLAERDAVFDSIHIEP